MFLLRAPHYLLIASNHHRPQCQCRRDLISGLSKLVFTGNHPPVFSKDVFPFQRKYIGAAIPAARNVCSCGFAHEGFSLEAAGILIEGCPIEK